MTDIDIPAAMEKAADFIEIPGNFGKGRFKRDDCYCTLGAYALGLGATFDDSDLLVFPSGASRAFDRGWDYLSQTVQLMPAGRFRVVQGMNDAPETTADQMAGVLRETAKRLRTASD